MKNITDFLPNPNFVTIYPYSDYMLLMESLVKEKKTTGLKQTENLIHYTKLNLSRMRRYNKTMELSANLQNAVSKIDIAQVWYIVTESWCGDAAHNMPVFAAVAALNPLITVMVILRDENLSLIDMYLTNGGRAIPKVISVDQKGNELFSWGPRSRNLQILYDAHKANPVKSGSEFIEEVQRWYNVDKSASTQKELTSILEGLLVER